MTRLTRFSCNQLPSLLFLVFSIFSGTPGLCSADTPQLRQVLQILKAPQSAQFSAQHVEHAEHNAELVPLLAQLENDDFKKLLTDTPDLDTLLTLAVRMENSHSVLKILEETRKRQIGPDDQHKKNKITALYLAVVKNLPEIVQILLKFGASPNHKSTEGFAPIHFSTQEGLDEITLLLAHYHADLGLLTSKSRTQPHLPAKATPMYQAAANGRLSTVILLCRLQADLQTTNEAGESPLAAASRFQHKAVVDYMTRNCRVDLQKEIHQAMPRSPDAPADAELIAKLRAAEFLQLPRNRFLSNPFSKTKFNGLRTGDLGFLEKYKMVHSYNAQISSAKKSAQIDATTPEELREKDNGEKSLECPVCFSSLFENEKSILVPQCGHMICRPCFVQTLGIVAERDAHVTVPLCPVCKRDICNTPLLEVEYPAL